MALREKDDVGVLQIELGVNGSDEDVQRVLDGTASLSARA